MKFNKFTWQLYVQSERGQKAIERFSHLTKKFIPEWHRDYDFEFFDEFKDQYPVPSLSIDIPKLVQDAVSNKVFADLEAANSFYRETVASNGILFETADKNGKKEEVFAFPETDEQLYDFVDAISLGLHLGQPQFFIPCNFECKFNQLEEIHAEFGIPSAG
ncbi:MAG: hypothetical protein NTW03_08285 [Verrucomicrobia bacterium]|nr:hypothetical protein [Verrucomicrobiota bacterium]